MKEILRGFAKTEPESEPTVQISIPEAGEIEPVILHPQVSTPALSISELPNEVLVNIPEAEKIETTINQPSRRVISRRSHELG